LHLYKAGMSKVDHSIIHLLEVNSDRSNAEQ